LKEIENNSQGFDLENLLEINTNYIFGKYAKDSKTLNEFCENFYKTGRKGIVNMIDTVPFRKGLEETYSEEEQSVSEQEQTEFIEQFTSHK
jgi:hypothetical protein